MTKQVNKYILVRTITHLELIDDFYEELKDMIRKVNKV